jgi:hypothetical protein
MGALVLGSFWCLIAYGLIGLAYPSTFVLLCIIVLILRENSRIKMLEKGEVQITSERQAEAIDEYVALVKKKEKC